MIPQSTPAQSPPYVVTVLALLGDDEPPLFRTYGPFTLRRANMIRREIKERIARQDWQRYKRVVPPVMHVGVSPVANYLWRADVTWETLT